MDKITKKLFLLTSTLYFAICLLSTNSFSEEGKYSSISSMRTGEQTVYGLVSPLDQDGKNFYVLNKDGLIEVKLKKDAGIGLLVREKDVKKLLEDRNVILKSVNQEHKLPKKLYVKVNFPNWKTAENVMKSGIFRDGVISAKPLADHLPTEKELWLSGELVELKPGHITPKKVVEVNDKTFEGSTSGYNYADQITGLFDSSMIKPFITQVSIIGELKDNVFYATDVFLRPIPDQTAKDDPKLPRYLFIGDSISGNYDQGLREALKGKFNIYHPPTNCGPSGKGKSSMASWLGDYKRKGAHWDVISFNFGHWDAGNTKAVYQANLESVIQQLKSTGAKLIWVTTCPVPNGFDPAGDLKSDGKAPGRTAGVMNKYLNPWALEIVKKHPEIEICDQWQFVKDHESDIYKDWWPNKNVHFKGQPANALGEYLAEKVLEVTKK